MNPQIVHLELLINIIIQKYFGSFDCTNIISDNAIININTNRTVMLYSFVNETKDIHNKLFTFGCKGFIVHASEPKKIFELIEYSIRYIIGTKFHERRYLIIQDEDLKDEDQDIFNSDKIVYVADLVLLKPNQTDDGFELWTHKFVGPDNFKEPLFLDKWFSENASFLYDANLYPDKLTNQQGRELRINTFDYKPYINIDTLHGSELRMALEYAIMHNLTRKMIIETAFWGVIFDNGTCTGAKATLYKDKSDISMGSWYRLPHYTRYFDLTETTLRIGVTFLVPAPNLAGGWFTPLLSFSPNLWIGFLLSFILAVLIFAAFDYFYNKGFTNTNVGKYKVLKRSFVISIETMLLQQPSALFLQRSFTYLRSVLLFLLILSLFYAILYGAGFSSVMTVPRYEPGIRTSDDLDRSDIKWGAIDPALLDGFKEIPKYSNVVKNLLILTNEEINNHMHKKGFAMLADRVMTGLALGNRVNADDIQYYRMLLDDFYSDHCVMLVKKSSVLIPTIRKAFLAMKEAGLVYIWEQQAIFEENYKAQEALALQKNAESIVVKLKWEHVQGAFGILWIGLVGGFLCFIWELFKKFTTKKVS